MHKFVCSSWCIFCSLSWKKKITIFASFHVRGMRRSVMQLVHGFASSFPMVASPGFNVSMVLLDLFPFISHFVFSSAQLPLPMPLLVVLLLGVCL